MSRRSPRYRYRLTVTATFAGGTGARGGLVCRTRNVSNTGLFLDIDHVVELGTTVELSLLDQATGDALELVGTVARCVRPSPGGPTAGIGIHLEETPEPWRALVARASREHDSNQTGTIRTAKRLRVLVVGDGAHRRGALALYVTSGWDVRFASDLEGAREALAGFRVDAIIAEQDLGDARWAPILEAARQAQPDARRIVRAPLPNGRVPAPGGPSDLVHRVVDQDAGLDAVLDALSADWARASG